MYRHLPVRHPEPDAALFIDTLLGKRRDVPARTIEYLVDDTLVRPIVTEMLGLSWTDGVEAWIDRTIAFWAGLGYDVVRHEQGLVFPKHSLVARDTAPGTDRDRSWPDEHHGVVTSWADFEQYPWPRVEDVDFSALEYLATHLPDGMGFITCHGGGPFEHVSQMLSLEGMGFLLHDDPALVAAVSERVGTLMEAYYRHIVDLPNLVAIFPGDDMGFRSSTMISPAHLRQYILPWHRRFAAMSHEKGLPYFLHSCGNVVPIMDDLIEDVKIDGKHSYEDAIVPIEEFQRLYGDRIAVLGGVDVDLLTRGTPDEVRARTRTLMETCGAAGRFAVGSGSSIASYIPVENYLSMLDEALDFRAGA